MTVTLELRPELQARAEAEAARRHLPIESLLEEFVSDALSAPSTTEQRERSLALLRSVADIGDESEQSETFDYLREAIDKDRLSNRKRFS